MILEVLKTLKGTDGTIWMAGKRYDTDRGDPVHPDLIEEAKLNRGTVRVLGSVPDLEAIARQMEKEKKETPSDGPAETKDPPPVPKFGTKSEIRAAKTEELGKFLVSRGFDPANHNREARVAQVIEIFEKEEI